MTLIGKGWFIWQVPRCEGGLPAAIADTAQTAGLTHVLLKIADRTYPFGYDRQGRDLLPPVAEALRARNVAVWGWHYVHGDDPVKEAAVAVARVRQLALTGYVIDAEKEYKRPGQAAAARTFMQALRAALPDLPIALSSYRYPTLHPQLPWREFLERCDYTMPQVYWEQSHNPDQQLARTVTEFSNPALVGHVRPVIPTGAAYGAGTWCATPQDIQKFLAKAVALKLSAANLYSWDFARAPEHTDLWEAARAFEWPTAPAPADLPQRFIEALNSGDPAAVLRLYHPTAAHVTARRTVVGWEDLSKWYLDWLKQRFVGARFTLLETHPLGQARRFRWAARGADGQTVEGEDTVGLIEGKIQYHYTSLAGGAVCVTSINNPSGSRK